MYTGIQAFLLVLFAVLVAPRNGLAQSIEESDLESLESLDGAAARPQNVKVDQIVSEIVAGTNKFRQEQGLEPVEENEQLMTTAQSFADYMARTDTYGHTADGNRPSQRAAEHGYEYCLISENIACQYSSAGLRSDELAQQFVTGWKESPRHRRNMLEVAVVNTGVGVAQSDRTGYLYAVQMFGRPKSAAIEFRIANHSEADVLYTIGDQSFDLPPRFVRTHTRCRVTTVDFQVADGGGETLTSLEPADGDSYVIDRRNGQLSARKTPSPGRPSPPSSQ